MNSWINRLKQGLSKTSQNLGTGLKALLTHRKLDEPTLARFEDLLISMDTGVEVAKLFRNKLKAQKFEKDITEEELKDFLVQEIAETLNHVASPLIVGKGSPHVILVIGVNGTGKTTTIAKLAHLWKGEGHAVMMAAGDTFRAAAVEQLKIWGEKLNIPVISKSTGSDPSSVAFEAMQTAGTADILLIDTAGRLHTKKNLMGELEKTSRVLQKIDPTAPHDILLVIDATTGQNAVRQVEEFSKFMKITGIILTKLDGTARGGILLHLADRFKLPVYALGVGEKEGDLRPFKAFDFAHHMVHTHV